MLLLIHAPEATMPFNQIVLALAVKTLSNYSNHVNHPELDEAFAGHAWKG